MEENLDSARLTVPNDISYGAVVCSCVKAMAKKLGFDDESTSMIELGVDEAFANVVEHAFEPDELATFDVVCEKIPLGLKVVIKEKGMPFDPSRIPEYDPGAKLEDMSSAGLGTFLMKKSMDEVSFVNLGTGGKETHLVKYLKGKNIEEYFDNSELERFEKPAEVRTKPRERIEFDVRSMDPAEAIEVSKCIYKAYGYTYGKENAYYPKRLVELNANGLLTSIVAVTKEGEMAGHVALMKSHAEDRVAEVGMAVVKPEFRGQGCLNSMAVLRMKKAREAGLRGIFGKGVATHPFSQKAMHKYGFRDCALMLATIPSNRSYKGISDELAQRDSVVIAFQYLTVPEGSAFYAPPHHLEMVEKLCANLGLSPEFKVPHGEHGTGPHFAGEGSVVKTRVEAAKGLAHVEVHRYGPGVAAEVKGMLKELCMKRVEMIFLHLDLRDQATYHMTQEFEEMGFFFAGVFPETSVGDALILQYRNNVPLDYGKIKTASELAGELKEYVRRHDPNEPGRPPGQMTGQ